MKKAMKKGLALVLSALMCVGILTSCGNSFSAGDLVQGNLDLIYLNKYSDDYLKKVNLTKEEADAQYEQGIDVEVDFFCDYFSIVEESCDESIHQQIVDLYHTIYQNAKYEVGGVSKNGDTYLVELTVYPIDTIHKVMTEDTEAFSAAWAERISSGEFEGLSDGDSALETAWAQAVIDMVNARVATVGYGEPQTISVQVVNGNNGYVIDDKDFGRIDALMIDYSAE